MWPTGREFQSSGTRAKLLQPWTVEESDLRNCSEFLSVLRRESPFDVLSFLEKLLELLHSFGSFLEFPETATQNIYAFDPIFINTVIRVTVNICFDLENKRLHKLLVQELTAKQSPPSIDQEGPFAMIA